MKETRQQTQGKGAHPQTGGRAPEAGKRPLRSTAAILARGVTLEEVRRAVRQLEPQVHHVS